MNKKRFLQLLALASGLIALLFFTIVPFISIRTNECPPMISNKMPKDIKFFYLLCYLICSILLAISILTFKNLIKRQGTKIFLSICVITVLFLIKYPYNIDALFSAYTGIGRDFLVTGRVGITRNPILYKIKNGMSKQDVRKILGKPEATHGNEWIYSYLFYYGDFTVVFDSKGKVIGKGYGFC